MPDDTMPVTVLGLGAMGTALAEALLAAGHPTTVWNRSPAKAEPLVARGAVAAPSAKEAVAASRLVVVCLLDNRSVHDVLGTATGALAGRAVVNLTNGTPGQARELAGWVAGQEADYVDGGIMAVPPMIGGPGAFVLYSGSRAVFDAYRPALDRFGESRYVGTDAGLAALQDLALLAGMYGMNMGVLHAFALVRSAGVPVAEFAPTLNEWLAAMGGFVDEAAGQIDSGDYTRDVVSSLAMQEAGFENHFIAAREQGIRPDLLAPLRSLMRRRVAEGHGDENLTGVIELLTAER